MRDPQSWRPSHCILSEEETLRFNRFIKACGTVRLAKNRLGLGDSTFDAARAFGRMQAKTRLRVLDALSASETVDLMP